METGICTEKNPVLEHKKLPARIFGLRFWIKNIDPQFLKNTFDNVLAGTHFKVLNFSEHFFPVQGYTAIWLLAESHLAIHTFPQNGWSYVELSGCNKQKTHAFKHIMLQHNWELKWDTNEVSLCMPE